jgi:hypothetical protein
LATCEALKPSRQRDFSRSTRSSVQTHCDMGGLRFRARRWARPPGPSLSPLAGHAAARVSAGVLKASR